LPGSYDVANSTRKPLYETKNEYKQVLFSMMPMAWCIKFAEMAHQLDDPNYKYSQLTQYLALQEAIDKNQRGKKRPQEATGSGDPRGRGRGRGPGRGRSPGHGGRGFGGRGHPRGGFGHGYGYAPYPQSMSGYPGSFQTQNRFLSAARGGRFGGYQSPRGGGGFASPGGRSYQSPGGRQVTNSPQRRMVQPRAGPPPQFPSFMAEGQYYHDHYYHDAPAIEQGNEQFYQGEGYPTGGDMYYGGDEMYHGEAAYQGNEMYHAGDEMYYQQGPMDDNYYGEEGQEQDQGQEEAQEGGDAHFLQDFGY
jgi:hypothetical protein